MDLKNNGSLVNSRSQEPGENFLCFPARSYNFEGSLGWVFLNCVQSHFLNNVQSLKEEMTSFSAICLCMVKKYKATEIGICALIRVSLGCPVIRVFLE